jgi:hypothetical protein
MLAAEESNEFFYEAKAAAVASTLTSRENEEDFADAYEDNDEDKYGAKTSKTLTVETNSIASLAKKIQETKLLSPSKTSITDVQKPQQSQPSPPPPPITTTSQQQQLIQDDLDLDIELDNVDTSDVNLDDDLSDD